MSKLLTSFFIIIALIGCNKESEPENTKMPEKSSKGSRSASELEVDTNGLSKAKATIKTVHGNIVFKFYPQKAPNTVTRIIELIEQGFYDGLTFHRVVPNFVIQGGDAKGNGTGGSGKNLKAEFNDIQHIKGAVAMARAQDPDSADSQFYIALSTLPHLDGKYTVFGQVIEGFDILTKVVKDDKMLAVTVEYE